MPRPLLIFPYNGNALEALACLGADFELIGFVDDTPGKQGKNSYGHDVFDRSAFARFPDAAVIAVPGSPTTYLGRASTIRALPVARDRFATVIHPRASVSPLAKVGANVLIMAGVVITSNAIIGDHVCVLPNTVIHHDVSIADYVLLGSNVTIAGGVVVGENAYIGSGTSVINGITVGARTLVGLGTSVIRNVPDDQKHVGNPGRSL